MITTCKLDDNNERHGKPSNDPDLLKIAKVLIDAGARLDHVTGEGEKRKTAIGLASEYGQADVVKFLLQAGAKVNETDGRGETALHAAAMETPQRLVLLQILLGAGADVNAKGFKGDPPLCRVLWAGGRAGPRIPRAGSGTWRFY